MFLMLDSILMNVSVVGLNSDVRPLCAHFLRALGLRCSPQPLLRCTPLPHFSLTPFTCSLAWSLGKGGDGEGRGGGGEGWSFGKMMEEKPHAYYYVFIKPKLKIGSCEGPLRRALEANSGGCH